jgi:hypothetical protein
MWCQTGAGIGKFMLDYFFYLAAFSRLGVLGAPAQIDLSRHQVRMQTVLPGTFLLE